MSQINRLSRASLFHLASSAWLAVMAVMLTPALGGERAASSHSAALTPLNRFPRMVQEYFVDQVRQVEEQADQQQSGLKSRRAAHGLRPRDGHDARRNVPRRRR